MRPWFLIAACLLAIPGAAQESARGLLSSRENFAFFAKNWSYRCDSADIVGYDPQITDHMRDFFQETIFTGLKTLEAINPEMIYAAMERTMRDGRDRLWVTCEGRADALASYQAPLVESMNGYISLGLVAYDVAVHHDPAALKQLGRTREDSYFMRHQAYLSMAAFHEFLHSLGIDNYAACDHNGYIFRRDHGLEADVVYACGVQAFPSPDYPIVRYKDSRYSNTRLACETCARAAAGKSGTYLDSSVQGDARAFGACGGLDEASFLIAD